MAFHRSNRRCPVGIGWLLVNSWAPGCGEPGADDGEVDPQVDLCLDPNTVCTVAGTGSAGSIEHEDRATKSPLYAPIDVAVWTGADDFFIGDWNNHKIRHVQEGTVRTIVGTDFLGDGDPDFEERVYPGAPGTEVGLNHPTQLEWNSVTGKLLLPSWHNHRIREWTPETGYSYVCAGDTDVADGNGANAGYAGDGGPASDALFAFPNSIAVDEADGSFWLIDQKNPRVRWIAADYSLIETVAGIGTVGYTGDGGPAAEASFFFWDSADLQPEPGGAIEHDAVNSLLYVVDTSNHVLRVVDLATGKVETLAGTGQQTLPGGACDVEALCFPRDIEIDSSGLLWIADTNNHVIRTFDPSSGAFEVVVGTFDAGDAEEGALALEAPLDRPFGIDIAPDGTLLIADTYNHRIRRVTP